MSAVQDLTWIRSTRGVTRKLAPMIRLRRQSLCLRIAMLTMVALLWSQVAMAGHVECLGVLAQSVPTQAATLEHGCDAEIPAAGQPSCAAHCSAGEESADSGRIPPVPPMLASALAPPMALLANGVPAQAATSIDTPPTASWNRPTAHPAALLLI